jgi:hypothetical protein
MDSAFDHGSLERLGKNTTGSFFVRQVHMLSWKLDRTLLNMNKNIALFSLNYFFTSDKDIKMSSNLLCTVIRVFAVDYYCLISTFVLKAS